MLPLVLDVDPATGTLRDCGALAEPGSSSTLDGTETLQRGTVG